jgi:hypothetical protein
VIVYLATVAAMIGLMRYAALSRRPAPDTLAR